MAFRVRERSSSRGDFKKGLDAKDSRRRREEVTASLRKNARLEQQQLKRRMGVAATPGEGEFQAGDAENNQNVAAGNLDAMLTPEEVMAHMRNLPAVIQAVMDPNSTAERKLEAVIIIRRLLSINNEPPIQAITSSGVIGPLVAILNNPASSPKIQFESLWALTNVASGTCEHCQILIKEGALQSFVRMTTSPSAECREQAVWALGNIAGDCEGHRDAVLRANGMQAVVNLIQPQNPAPAATLRQIAWALSNMCRGKNPAAPWAFTKNAIAPLAWLLHYDDTETIQDAAWGLLYATENPGEHNENLDDIVKQRGLLPRMVYLLDNADNLKIAVTPLLRALGNILTGTDAQTDAVLEANGVAAIGKLLFHDRRAVKKEAAWSLSNVGAGQPAQIEHLFKHEHIMRQLIKLLRNGDVVVRREAAWTLANVCTCGDDSHRTRLIQDAYFVSSLCEALKCGDRSIIKVVCEALVALLKFDDSQGDRFGFLDVIEECDGLDSLEELQNHSDESVYKAVAQVFENIKDVEEDGGDATTHETGEDGNFGFSGGFPAPAGQDGGSFGGWNL